jgi:outer membrane protein OmpA-like peptidoglycan-associated protein
VLVTGGTTGTTTLDSAQIYDPVGNGWSAVFHMSAKRAYHTATALPSGQVLVAGGEDDGTDLGTAELFTESPAAPGGSFAVTAGPMTAMRSHHAAALLQDGSVLLTGGDAAGAVLRSTEIYGVDGMFTAAGDMTATRAGHTATPLLSGEVLVVGGRDAGGAPLGSAELYRPGSRDFSASPSGTVLPRADHAASILPGGLVLIAGGADENGESLQDARQYDPAANRFSLADGLTLGRALETATLLPDGTVLAYGGAGRRPPDELVDLYSAVSPAAGRPTPDLTSVDQTRVPGGDLHLAGVALLGGFEASGGAAQSSAVNHPVIELVRAGGDGQARAAITQLADGTATARLPKTLLPGWWWARMVTAGVPGKALPFRVYPPFDITPQDPTTCFPRGTIDFTVSGGAGGPYTWSWASPPASGLGADISAGGHYVAGANGSTPAVDVVKVTDAGGNDSLVHITVGVGISISVVPVSAEITTRGHAQFSASGGDGGPYGWAVTTAASGAATIDASGAYTAGSTPGVDTIQVTDALGNTATATITVDRPLTIDPQGPLELFPGEAQHFVTDGGSGKSLAWTITPNGSGAGAVVLSDPEGVAADYTAGRTGNSDDTLHVQDSVGNFVIVSIHVKPGITIDPFTAPPPGGSIGFTAQGGTGDGWVWDFAPGGNRSGASIDPGTGAYTAGHTGSVTDVVMVTDRLQNVATAQVAVGPGITISPVEPGAYPGGTVTLTATGGSGAGYTWTIETLRSGTGSITTAADGTGVYQAGSVRGAIDVVKVVDSLGNEATVDVAVWPDWQAKGSGCSSGGGNGAAGLLALALLLALRARPRLRRALARAGAAGLGLLALVGAARAQTPTPPATTSFVVQRFQPSGGAFDVLTVESAQTAGRLAGSIQLWGNYGHRPLIVVAPGVKDAALLKSQTGLDLALSLGLTDWAEVSAVVPFTASQSREENRLLPPDLRPAIASSGLGDVRLVPKVRLVDYRALRLGVAVPISFPTGKKDSYLGHGALTYAPKALVELDGLGPVRLLLNGGAIFREDRELVALTVGNAYTYGAGLEWALGQQFAALASFAGEAGMKDRSAAARPMEALGALRWQALGGLHFTVGGGPGVGDGYGTPQYRVFAELGYTGADHRRLDRREPPPKPEPVVAKQEEPKPEPVKAEEPKPEPKAEPVPDKVEVPAEEEVPAPEVVNGELRIDARIYFAFNRKELRPQFEPVLDQIAQRIVAEPRMKMVRIEGHADDLGPPEYNVWLSLERAKVVQAFLVHHGVPAKRVVIVGYGKMHPAEKGKSKASRAKNRRVEFNVQER